MSSSLWNDWRDGTRLATVREAWRADWRDYQHMRSLPSVRRHPGASAVVGIDSQEWAAIVLPDYHSA